MIPVRPQPAPVDFERKVAGRGKRVFRNGHPKSPVPASFWNGKEHWKNALDDLMEAYNQICAFTAFRVERTTGARSVEHFRPKSKYPELAYDWKNYRLVCSRMNGRKGDYEDVLDPFRLAANTFDLEPLLGKVLIHRDCPKHFRKKAQSTIDRLGLNSPECLKDRQEHLARIQNNDWSLAEARRQSPFVVACLEQQSLL